MTTGDQNCRFRVRATGQAPVADDQGWQIYDAEVGQELVVDLQAYDPDPCDTVGFWIYQFLPQPAGNYSIDSLTGEFRFTPDNADMSTRFDVNIAVTFAPGGASLFYHLVIDVGPNAGFAEPYVRIDTISNVRPGQTFDLPVWLERTNREIDSAIFHIAYDRNMLQLNGVRNGSFLNDCGWPELSWQDVSDSPENIEPVHMDAVKITRDSRIRAYRGR